MTEISFTDAAGTVRVVDGKINVSLMEAALRNGIPGILAECGGACACATCHIYIAPEWWEVVGRPSALEADMLDFADEVRETSRLSCQVRITEEMHGLRIETPARQA